MLGLYISLSVIFHSIINLVSASWWFNASFHINSRSPLSSSSPNLPSQRFVGLQSAKSVKRRVGQIPRRRNAVRRNAVGETPRRRSAASANCPVSHDRRMVNIKHLYKVVIALLEVAHIIQLQRPLEEITQCRYFRLTENLDWIGNCPW